MLAEEPDEEFQDLLKSLTIVLTPVKYASFDDDIDTLEMPINVQKKGWEDILRKQCIVKFNADPDQIDISSDNNDLEDDDHIEAIEEENPQMSFAAALQMLDQLQGFASFFADTEMQCQSVTITEKLQDVRLQHKKQASIKDFFSKNFQCGWYIRFVYLYLKNCFFYSLHLILPLLLMDNSQKSHKSKNNVWRTKDLSVGLRSYENRETFSRRAPV